MKTIFKFTTETGFSAKLIRSEDGKFHLETKEANSEAEKIVYQNFGIAADEYSCFLMRHINDATN